MIMKKIFIVLALVLCSLALLPTNASALVEELRTKCYIVYNPVREFCETELLYKDMVIPIEHETKLDKYLVKRESLNMKEEIESTIEFDKFEWDSNKVKISGFIKLGTQNYWSIEGVWNSTWWNSSYNMCMNLTHYQDDNPFVREDELVIYNATELTIFNYSELVLINESCNNSGYVVPFDVILNFSDNTQQAGEDYALLAYYVNRSYDGNTTYSLYFNTSFDLDPEFDDKIIRYDKDARKWYINATGYLMAEFWYNSGGIGSDILSKNELNIGDGSPDNSGIMFAGHLHTSVLGNVLWTVDSEEDDTCTVLHDGTQVLIILCEAGEDSNEDGDYDAGETVTFWYFGKDSFDIDYYIGLDDDFSVQLHQDRLTDYFLFSTGAGDQNQTGSDWYRILNKGYHINADYDTDSTASRIKLFNISVSGSEEFRTRYDVYSVSGRVSGDLDTIDSAYHDRYQTRTIISYNESIDWTTGEHYAGIFENPLKVIGGSKESLGPPEPEPDPVDLSNITVIDYYCTGNNSVRNETLNNVSTVTYIVCDNGCNDNNLVITVFGNEANLCNPSIWLQWIMFISILLIVFVVYDRSIS